MSEPRGAIPRLFTFILGLILGFWFAVPSPIDISVMILEALQSSLPDYSQNVWLYILSLRLFGVFLIIADIVGIYVSFRRREYF